MTSKLEEAEWKLDCLNSRMDAVCELSSRADADSKSGTVTVVLSNEFDLGAYGGGEVEYTVKVTYKFDLEFSGVRSADWTTTDRLSGKEISVPKNKLPMAAIQRAVEKDIARRRGEIVSEAAEKL